MVSLKRPCNQIQEISCVSNTPNTMANCIGALVRRRDGDKSVILMVEIYFYNLRLQKPLSTFYIALVSPSLHRTSAPIQFTIVWVCWGHKRLFVIWLQGCLRETIFILRLLQIYKPQVIHLREMCYCPTNLCTWRPNNVYKKKVVQQTSALDQESH